jgi:hypothetical protein
VLDRDVYEALQREAVRRLREVFGDRGDVVIAIVGQDRRVLWASEAGARGVFGREEQAFVGTNVDDYVHPDDLSRLVSGLERVFAGHTASWTVRGRAADGSWINTRNTAWQADADRGLAIILTAVDVHDGS